MEVSMSIVDAKEMLLKATKGKYAVGAFNVTNIIQMEAVVAAAENRKSPLIIQSSVSPTKFLRPEVLVAVYRTLADNSTIPICLHLDHCDDVEYCKTCADAGYTNIMIDASKHDIATNILQTREIADYCHRLGGISVEGELGTVCGIEDQVKVAEDEAALCDPLQVLEFIEKTSIDLFAPAIGTAHGVYKTKFPKLDFERLYRIFQILNGSGVKTPLVIHGGTGLQPDVVKKLVSLGGSKFNVSTDLKHALIDTTYQYISAHPDEYNPGKIDQAVRKSIMGRIDYWIDLLGCAGMA
ncbi:MAG: ketose-bisphosphate aldolase [Desulfobacteraceae bacterium]|nr:MAG: ketose-bisphosphate aldolase [Desulfobacteraceae bacterium]